MARQLHDLHIETIRPASPTPSHLKRYNLSPMDQVTPRIYMPIVFNYPNHVPSSLKDVADKSSQLKSSLSEILTHYYPFGGRLRCGAYVDCNDKGVEFQEANIKCGLSEILEKPENEAVGLVFPSGLAWGKMDNGSMNMRPKMLPPLPETSMGNLYWPISIPTRNESENNFNTLAWKIKNGKMEIEGMKNLDATKHLSIHHDVCLDGYVRIIVAYAFVAA
ncbi:hypothetical protein LguiB_005513 [Lonicera macranthoides]